MDFQLYNLDNTMLRDLSSVCHILMISFCTFNVNPSITKVTLDRFIVIFNFQCAYSAWVMFCHIEFLQILAVKVSKLVRKKTKKKAIDY